MMDYERQGLVAKAFKIHCTLLFQVFQSGRFSMAEWISNKLQDPKVLGSISTARYDKKHCLNFSFHAASLHPAVMNIW